MRSHLAHMAQRGGLTGRDPCRMCRGSGSGHGPPVTVQTKKFCNFFARDVKMKCPKSEEFLFHTQVNTL